MDMVMMMKIIKVILLEKECSKTIIHLKVNLNLSKKEFHIIFKYN